MKTTKILVTGGAGFIGSHLADRLLAGGFEVTVLDNFSTGRMQNIACNKDVKKFRLVRGDVRDVGRVKKAAEEVDVVFHQAALVDVVLSVGHPLLFNEVNVVGTLNLLKVSVDLDVKRFIFASSAAVYGYSKPVENMIPRPISPYGASKLAAENYVQMFSESYGLETVSLRYFNVYGPRQSFGCGVVNTFVRRLLNDQPPIIHGDGSQTRDFVHVDDVVSANMLALESKKAVGEVFNIASGTLVAVNKLAKMLQRITDMEHLKPVFTKTRAGDIKHGSSDIRKAQRLLGFHPKIKLNDGLSRLVKWQRCQRGNRTAEV